MIGSFVCAPHVVRFRSSTIINRASSKPAPSHYNSFIHTSPHPPTPQPPSPSSPSVHPSCSLHLQTLHIFVSFGMTRLLVFVQPGILYISASRIRRAGRSVADVDVLCETSAASATDPVSGTHKRQCVEFTHGRGVTVNPFSWPSHFIRIARQ